MKAIRWPLCLVLGLQFLFSETRSSDLKDADACALQGEFCQNDAAVSLLQREKRGKSTVRTGASKSLAADTSAIKADEQSQAGRYFRRSRDGQKLCVIIASVSHGALGRMGRNAYHAGEECDFVFGHYDLNMAAYEEEPWYHEVVALGKSQKFYNKIDLVRFLVDEEMELLNRYKFALLLDDDMDLCQLHVRCFAKWFASSPYNIASPYAPDKEDWKKFDNSSCAVRVTDELTPTVFAVKMDKLSELADMVLEETIGDDGLVRCDFGTMLTMCRWIAGKPVTAEPIMSNECAYVDKCGAVLHDHIKTPRPDEHWQICVENVGHYMRRRGGYVKSPIQRCENPTVPLFPVSLPES